MTSLWFESALLPQGWVADVRISAAAGRIAALEAGVRPEPQDERHRTGVPGMPNLHSHAFQRALAGRTERRGASADSFWSWRELMYRFVERLEPEGFEALTAFAFAEMLEAGFTRVGEFHYLHRDPRGSYYTDAAELAARVAAAASDSGIALTLLPVFYAHAGFRGQPPAPRQRRFVSDPEGFARLLEGTRRALAHLPGSRLGIAPHSLRAVTPAELTAVLALGEGGPVHLHIAEQQQEVDDCVGWCGQRPIEWLLAAAAVDERWCLVHATHATSAELAGIAASGAVVGLCPSTEANLGDGIFPAVELLNAQGRFGIGSDSNVRLDAAEELRLLEYSQRLAHRARNVLASGPGGSTGRALFEATLRGGTQALLGPQAPVGLTVGAPCDLVALALPAPAPAGADELLDAWIFSAGRSAVDSVWSGGVKVVSGGRHYARERLEARYAGELRALLG
ncbi:MAG: formimidoylglutamate deiminase [Gammaproteobacteria bacterium]|nr:formimidoylglutamate deiminase [Gammaproteobacteria bacterium]